MLTYRLRALTTARSPSADFDGTVQFWDVGGARGDRHLDAQRDGPTVWRSSPDGKHARRRRPASGASCCGIPAAAGLREAPRRLRPHRSRCQPSTARSPRPSVDRHVAAPPGSRGRGAVRGRPRLGHGEQLTRPRLQPRRTQDRHRDGRAEPQAVGRTNRRCGCSSAAAPRWPCSTAGRHTAVQPGRADARRPGYDGAVRLCRHRPPARCSATRATTPDTSPASAFSPDGRDARHGQRESRRPAVGPRSHPQQRRTLHLLPRHPRRHCVQPRRRAARDVQQRSARPCCCGTERSHDRRPPTARRRASTPSRSAATAHTLATASSDRTARLWDVATRKQLGVAGDQSQDTGEPYHVVHRHDVRPPTDGRSSTATRDVSDRTIGRSGPAWPSCAGVCTWPAAALTHREWAQYASGISYRHSC